MVKKQVQDHLTNIPSGKVTPKGLQKAVNNKILPELGINPKTPISVHTVQQWLLKLGW